MAKTFSSLESSRGRARSLAAALFLLWSACSAAPPQAPSPRAPTLPVEAPSSTEASTKAADTRPVASSAPTEHYQRGKKSRDGLGLFYMGRELAHFMSHEGAPWLERSSRETEEKPAEVVAALSLRPTDVVADVGAGTGYFSFRIAPLVPQGKVVAVDIQPEMLDAIRKKQEKLGLNNLETRLSTEDNPQLAPNSIDVALFVDVYHELSKPREVMEQVAASLKPGGRVVLIEYRGEDPSVPIKELHKMTEAQAKKELAAVGLRWTETKDFLPWQHLMIFTK